MGGPSAPSLAIEWHVLRTPAYLFSQRPSSCALVGDWRTLAVRDQAALLADAEPTNSARRERCRCQMSG